MDKGGHGHTMGDPISPVRLIDGTPSLISNSRWLMSTWLN